MRFKASALSLTIPILAAACASTPGAQPNDMSAAQHEAMANEQAKNANAHERQFDPAPPNTDEGPCGGAQGNAGELGRPCWTEDASRTSEHLDAAKRLRKMADDHRAASRALRDAEGRACVGISETARDESPFSHRQDIVGVEPLDGTPTTGKSEYTTREGAIVTLRAVNGLTAEWLQRVVDCHLARNAALGHVVPEMPECPLVPNGVSATVTPVRAGFAVTIRANDTATADEVMKRAQALVRR
jgi:hypothetical protein